MLWKICCILFLPFFVYAQPELPQDRDHYYGKSFFERNNQNLRKRLYLILSSFHRTSEHDFDEIVSQCDAKTGASCYKHAKHSYRTARQYMFGSIHLQGDHASNYLVTSSYCQWEFTNDDLPKSKNLGPMKIPSGTILNTEHAWPQSKFNQSEGKGFQKADLHALYPVRSRVNSQRGNHPFGEVTEQSGTSLCDDAKLGYNEQAHYKQFEPADEIKGDIARSLFYFSVRYKMPIDQTQEKFLRKWHKQDPVDLVEQSKNEQVFRLQYTRNPFVDYPDLVNEIQDF